jgi:hypothetical protein
VLGGAWTIGVDRRARRAARVVPRRRHEWLHPIRIGLGASSRDDYEYTFLRRHPRGCLQRARREAEALARIVGEPHEPKPPVGVLVEQGMGGAASLRQTSAARVSYRRHREPALLVGRGRNGTDDPRLSPRDLGVIERRRDGRERVEPVGLRAVAVHSLNRFLLPAPFFKEGEETPACWRRRHLTASEQPAAWAHHALFSDEVSVWGHYEAVAQGAHPCGHRTIVDLGDHADVFRRAAQAVPYNLNLQVVADA